ARKILGPQAKGLRVRFGSLQHGRHMPIVLPIAKGLRMHDDLMFGIDQRLAIVTLQYAMSGEHLLRLVIRDITLQLLTLLPAFGSNRRSEHPYASRLFFQALELLLSLLRLSASGGDAGLSLLFIGALMLGKDPLELLLQFLLLPPQIGKRATPFFGRIRGQLDPIQGKVAPP